MISIKSSREIALMKKAGEILATTFDVLEPLCIPGTTTKHLSEVAEKVIRDAGGIPEENQYRRRPDPEQCDRGRCKCGRHDPRAGKIRCGECHR